MIYIWLRIPETVPFYTKDDSLTGIPSRPSPPSTQQIPVNGYKRPSLLHGSHELVYVVRLSLEHEFNPWTKEVGAVYEQDGGKREEGSKEEECNCEGEDEG